jgi:hypothetical protein
MPSDIIQLREVLSLANLASPDLHQQRRPKELPGLNFDLRYINFQRETA